jgi:hypothetical protein
MAPAAYDPVVDQAAWMTHARLTKSTPKRWFGQVRRGWIVARPALGSRLIINKNKIMLFLEEGTRDHGPREIYGPLRPGQPRKKKAMFIPLTRRAANATQGIYGVGSTTIVRRHTEGAATISKVRAIFQRTQSVRKGRTRTSSRALIFGQDYVLAARVRGIRAMHIVQQERPKARELLKRLMKAHMHKAIRGGANG